ncbi:MAG: CDP-alcohol phosphatidyltransferase family protein [Candidatus Omnitrophica bacterium]|nr:CDP-alcohol phosphatidyltransferase family protein [Candidatus Omnitrophota bacterium]
MTIYDFKPKFQIFLKPVLFGLHKKNVTPNQMTLAALLGSFAAGALCLQAAQNLIWLLVLPFWLFIRMALNALDGMLARDFDLKSRLGMIFNEVGDIVSDGVLYLPLAFVNHDALWPIVLFVLGAVLTEFCGVLGAAMGTTRHYEGPMGKSDRAFFVGALALATFFFPALMMYWKFIFLVGFVLCLWTGFKRSANILKELSGG